MKNLTEREKQILSLLRENARFKAEILKSMEKCEGGEECVERIRKTDAQQQEQ